MDTGSCDHAMNTSIRYMRPDLAEEFTKKHGKTPGEFFGTFTYKHKRSGRQVSADVFPFHNWAFQEGLLHAENIGGDIELMLNKRCLIGAFPWRYEGLEGCPCRIVCFVDAAHFVHGAFLGYLWCFTRLLIRGPSGRKRFNVLGAIDAVTHELTTVVNDTVIDALGSVFEQSIPEITRDIVDITELDDDDLASVARGKTGRRGCAGGRRHRRAQRPGRAQRARSLDGRHLFFRCLRPRPGSILRLPRANDVAAFACRHGLKPCAGGRALNRFLWG